jgi:outer membrane biosynthesis protein TonB
VAGALEQARRQVEEAKKLVRTDEERRHLDEALSQVQQQIDVAKKQAQAAGAKDPAVAAAPAEQVGDCDRNEIARVMKHKLHKISSCYEHSLKDNPTLMGKLVVRFTIGSSGRVQSVQTTEDTLKDERVKACVQSAVQKLVFSAQGSECTVSYPFVFNTQN